MDLGLKGKVSLVMGASRGIGRGIATALAAEGATVAIASRSEQGLSEVATEVSGELRPYVADTADLERMRSLPEEVIGDLGRIDILITNTGGPPPGHALENPGEEWQAAYHSLVLAPTILIEGTLPGMLERGWGRIVNVGSTSTREPLAGLALSNAHRAAAVGLFKTLAGEVAAKGVTVNTVATGRIATERIAAIHGSIKQAEQAAREAVPAERLGTPEEYGSLVAFICSERAAYLTGTVIPLDGGLLRSV